MSLRLSDQLCFALYSASRAMTAAYQPLLEPLGLTYPQYLVMLVLWERAPQSVREIGDALALDSGTLTPLLKRLESQGLVTRTRSAEDERVVLIGLTREGKRLREPAKEIPEKLVCRAGQPTADLGALRDELHALARCLRADPDSEG